MSGEITIVMPSSSTPRQLEAGGLARPGHDGEHVAAIEHGTDERLLAGAERRVSLVPPQRLDHRAKAKRSRSLHTPHRCTNPFHPTAPRAKAVAELIGHRDADVTSNVLHVGARQRMCGAVDRVKTRRTDRTVLTATRPIVFVPSRHRCASGLSLTDVAKLAYVQSIVCGDGSPPSARPRSRGGRSTPLVALASGREPR
jgi:hypothetical protein